MPRSFADYYLRIYFEIYLWAKKKMVYPYHDFVKLTFDRIVALPKQLTLSYAVRFRELGIAHGPHGHAHCAGFAAWPRPRQNGQQYVSLDPGRPERRRGGSSETSLDPIESGSDLAPL